MDPSPALSFAVDVKPRALAFAKLFACIAVAVITYQYILLGFLWIRARYMLRKLPRPAEDATILGFPKKFASPQRHIATLEMTKLGPIVYLRVLKTQLVLISDPHLVAEILEHPRMTKTVRDLYSHFRRLMHSSMAEPDLITAAGGSQDAVWKQLRKGLAPAFTLQNVKKGFEAIRSHGRELAQVLQGKGANVPVDMCNALICVTIDSIADWGFQLKWDNVASVENSDCNVLVEVLRKANLHTSRRGGDVVYRTCWWGRQHRAGLAAITAFHKLARDIWHSVLKRKDALEKETCIASQLLRMRDAHGKPISARLMQAQIAAFFWAGHDTTGNTMAWCLFAIAIRPEVEARIVRELDSLGLLASPQNPNPRELTLDDLPKLVYLNAVIKEAMRYHTVVPTVTSRINDLSDTVLSNGFVIPRRTGVLMPQIGLHMNSSLFEEPDKFNPERWLETNPDFIKVEPSGKETEAPSSGSTPHGKSTSARDIPQWELGERGFVRRFMPFSYGRRDCVGRTFAQLSVVTHLTTLLSRYHFRLAEEVMGPPSQVEADQSLRVTMSPGKGMWMYAESRCT